MITTKTVFVLGAGASMPYGFPSGQTLVERIIAQGDDYGWLMNYGFALPLVKEFVEQLFYSDCSSIDAFLEHRTKFMEVGKTAIAFHLIRSEVHNAIFEAKNWYTLLFERMSGHNLEAFANNNVGVITFNYDRSLEHYLFTALRNRYETTDDDVKKVLSHIPIIHVHGRLGYLPWQDFAPQNERREYEALLKKEAIQIAASGIKIISDNLDDTAEFVQARDLMNKAERIGFLGFGYHPRNMERLKVPANKVIRGTAYKYTTAEIQSLHNRYGRLSLVALNHDCCNFFRNVLEFMFD